MKIERVPTAEPGPHATDPKLAPRVAGLLRTVVSTGFLTLLLLEATLWLLVPLADPYHSERSFSPYIRREHQPNATRTTVPEPGLPGMEGISVWTTNNVGFRGDELILPKPANEYRVIMIGGSTTECLILDNADSIDAIVQRATQEAVGDRSEIRVYNAGISGDRSDDHVAILTQRIVHMEPDLIVVFAGINDLRAAIDGHDYLHYPTPARPPWMLLVTQAQIGRLAYYVAHWRTPARDSAEDNPIETGYRLGVELQRTSQPASKPLQTDVEAYKTNLRTMAGVAASQGIDMILMTQQTTWNSAVDPTASEWHWLLRVGDVRYSEVSMNQALEEMNDTMRDVALIMAVPLYDLARRMPKSSEYFYDDVHFNIKGAHVAGNELSQLVLEQFEARFPRDESRSP